MPRFVVPPPLRNAVTSWRKAVERIDPRQTRSRVVVGEWLEPGATYDVPPGALIALYDNVTGVGHVVRVGHVDADGRYVERRQHVTRPAKRWDGPAVMRMLTTAAAAHPWPLNGVVVLARHAPNAAADTCARCGTEVAAGAGIVTRVAGRRVVVCGVDCPTPPDRNRYAGTCDRCGVEVPARAGILMTNRAGSRRVVVHGTAAADCPPVERQPVEWRPVEVPGAPWRVTRTRTGPYRRPAPRRFRVGEILRGTVGDDQPTVPDDAPGRVRNGYRTSAIFAVVAELPARYCRDADGDNPAGLLGVDGWLFTAAVRLATDVEAAPLLREERAYAVADRVRAELDYLLTFETGERFGHDADRSTVLDLPGVRVSESRDLPQFAGGAPRHLRVDEPGGRLWIADASAALVVPPTVPGYVLTCVPLDDAAAALVELCRREYGDM